MNGTTSRVTFSNGSLTSLETDLSGPIVTHTHIALNILINGTQVQIPEGLGIMGGVENSSQYVYGGITGPIHTHDRSNVVHFETSIPEFNFTLGDVFNAWGYAFNSSCVWGRCGGTTTVYTNSHLFNGTMPQTITVPKDMPEDMPYNVTIVWKNK